MCRRQISPDHLQGFADSLDDIQTIEFCKQAGITLVGYLRGESLEVYSHPQ